MLDRESNYVKHYLKKVGEVTQHILNQDYSSLQEYRMPLYYGYVEQGHWYFKIVKSKDTGICLTKCFSSQLNDLINDKNIMCIGVNRFPPGSVVKEHVDPPYYGKNLWRILVPIKASDAYLKGMYGAQKIEEGKCYIFDITYELHHGWNSSKEEDFVIMTIDILYEDQSDYDLEIEGNSMNKNYSKKQLRSDFYKKIENIDLSMYERVE